MRLTGWVVCRISVRPHRKSSRSSNVSGFRWSPLRSPAAQGATSSRFSGMGRRSEQTMRERAAIVPIPALDGAGSALGVKPLRPELIRLLRCQQCGGALRTAATPDNPCAAIMCTVCRRQTPVIEGIPRFVDTPVGEPARRTQASFGYEWTHFNDWRESGVTNFADYFDGIDLRALSGATVLDAGCGMGRHAR